MDWKILSGRIQWNVHNIKKYFDYIDWNELSLNSNVKFGLELIKEYKDLQKQVSLSLYFSFY